MLLNKKNIAVLISLMFLLGACHYEVPDLFDKPASERYKESYEKIQKDLLGAENGWVMEYFPTDESVGYVLLVKFETKDSVTFAANNSVSGNKYQTAGSRYEVLKNSNPILNFNTYNDIFHKFSDPDPDGVGMGGDFEFFIIREDENSLELKGRKRNTRIMMTKCPENISWENYASQINEMKNFLFTPGAPYLYLTVDDERYELTGGSSSIFQIKQQNVDDAATQTMPFVITLSGLRFYKPFETERRMIQTFGMSSDKNSLVCTDDNVNAKIEGILSRDYFCYMLNYNKSFAFETGTDGMSDLIRSIYDKIKASLLAKDRNITLLALGKDKNFGTSLAIHSAKGTNTVRGYISFDFVQKNESEIILTFNGFNNKTDNNGKVYYEQYAGVSELVSALEGTYQMAYQGSLINPSHLRFISTTDANKWFNLAVK